MDLSKLVVLRDMLRTATDFSAVFSYFLDNFAESREFIGLGEPTKDPFVESVVGAVGSQIFGKNVAPPHLLLSRVPGHHFLHGGFLMNGKLATVIYFEDVPIGLVAVVNATAPGETKYARFTRQKPPRRGEPSAN